MREFITNIHPGDGTREENWQRACKLIPTLLEQGAVDLAKYPNIQICRGSLGLVAVDGNHTLARIFQITGNSGAVTFSLNTSDADVADDLITIMQRRKIPNFNKFLIMCQNGKFTRQNST